MNIRVPRGRALRSLVVAAASAALVPLTAIAQTRVALESGSTHNSTDSLPLIKQMLVSKGYSVDIVSATQLNSVAAMNAYNVICIGDSGYSDNDWNTISTNLKAYVQGGGGLVESGWVPYMIATGHGGQPLTDITPVVAATSYYSRPGFTVTNSASSLNAGVGSWTLPSFGNYGGGVKSGATSVAAIIGQPAVVYWNYGSGRVIHLAANYFVSTSAYNQASEFDGTIPSGQKSLLNAIDWAALPASIGVSFTGGTWSLGATDQPGLVAGQNWNNEGGIGGTSGANTGAGVGSNVALNDYHGNATTAVLSYEGAYDDGYAGNPGTATANAATNTLYKGSIWGDPASREATFTVTNIPYGRYDLYVFANGNDGGGHTLSVTDGTTTYYFRSTVDDSSATSLLQTTSTDASNPTTGPGQYQVFRGLTSSSVTITTGGSINGVVAAQIYGFQIVSQLQAPPVVTSATNASGTVSQAFSYTITGSNTPTSYGATNLPAGLSVNTQTGVISGTPTAYGTFSATISATNSGGTGSATLTITIVKGTATVTLTNLSQTYDGSAKSAGATTSPANLGVSFSYTGAALPPINAGSYGVLASITDPNYTGSASGTLVINPAALSVSLGNLTQSYNGQPHAVSVSTNPNGVAVAVTYNGSTTAPTYVGSYSVLATSADANYTGSASGTLTIADTTPPVLSLPANITVEATSADGAFATFTATANDDVSGSVPVTFTPASGSTFPLGTTTVTAIATDAAGNTATGSFTVTVQDTTPPTIATPANITAEATSSLGASVNFTVTAADAVSGAVSVAASPASGSTFPLGTTTVKLTSSDAAGNTSTSSFTVTVQDTTAPALALPGDITAEATGPNGAAVTFNPQASDVVGVKDVDSDFESPAVAANACTYVAFNSTATLGAWTWHGYGGILNGTGGGFAPLPSGHGTQHALIQSFGGVQSSMETANSFPVVAGQPCIVTFYQATRAGFSAPTYDVTFNGPAGSTEVFRRSAVLGEGWTKYTATFVPTVSGNYTLAFNGVNNGTNDASFFIDDVVLYNSAVPVITTPASGSTFALGTTTVNASATDTAGNTATGSFNVTVKDTTPPTITTPADIVTEATGASGAVVTFSATATDIVDGSVSVTASPASGSTFAIGTTTVTLTSTDAAGNTATSTFKVTVRDTTPPVISTPANIVAEATSANGAVVTFNPTATDIVDGTDVVTASPASGSTFALGTTTVALTAIDAHGNKATSSFTVTVHDTTPPALTVPQNLVLEATSAAGAVANYAATATDAVTASPAITYSIAPGSTFPLGTSTVNVTATDAAGNKSTGSFTVTVRDTTPPALTVPANQTIEATGPNGAVATYTASATDAVTTSPTIAYSIASGTTFALGATTVTVSATDAAGNKSVGSFTVTVQDTTPPTLTVPANLVLEATSSAGAVANFAATATDIVTASPTITYSAAPGSTFAIGTTTVQVTATDAAGNKSTGSFTVTVRDTTPPAISSLTASPNTLWSPNKKMVPVTISAVTSDAVGVASVKIVSVATNEPNGSTQWQVTGDLTLNLLADRLGTGTGRVYTITVEARDAAGNASQRTVTVSVPHDQGK